MVLKVGAGAWQAAAGSVIGCQSALLGNWRDKYAVASAYPAEATRTRNHLGVDQADPHRAGRLMESCQAAVLLIWELHGNPSLRLVSLTLHHAQPRHFPISLPESVTVGAVTRIIGIVELRKLSRMHGAHALTLMGISASKTLRPPSLPAPKTPNKALVT